MAKNNNKPRMSWRELLVFLKKLEENNDKRLDDDVIVYSTIEGEYYPADVVEFEGEDDVIDNKQLFVMAFDWDVSFDVEIEDEDNENG